jgi:hypothetical protein
VDFLRRAQAAVADGAASLAALVVAALPDVVGLCGLALCVVGVDHNWGQGWALIAAGGPLVAAYAWREVRSVIRPRRD